MALRIGLFYTAASLSGAFGGKHLSIKHWAVWPSNNENRTTCSWFSYYWSCWRPKAMVLDFYY